MYLLSLMIKMKFCIYTNFMVFFKFWIGIQIILCYQSPPFYNTLVSHSNPSIRYLILRAGTEDIKEFSCSTELNHEIYLAHKS